MKYKITRKEASEILGVSLSRIGALVQTKKIDLNDPDSLQVWAQNKRGPFFYKIRRSEAAKILGVSLSRIDKLIKAKKIDLNDIDSLKNWEKSKGKALKPEQIKIQGRVSVSQIEQDSPFSYPNNLLSVLYQSEPYQAYLNESNFEEKISELFVEAKLSVFYQNIIIKRFKDGATLCELGEQNFCTRENIRQVLTKGILRLREVLKRHIKINIQKDTLLTQINLSNRAYNKLSKIGVTRVQDLIELDLTKVNGIGATTKKEIIKVLDEIQKEML